MPELIDAKGLGCGVPVILAKKALESHDEITVLVDDIPNLENLKVLARHLDCMVNVKKNNGSFLVNLKKTKCNICRNISN
ncbi:MAG TPA: sulfurtransferase TusA family protein [Syntrophorhabdaceae bacterium]|nr:sulfurtransferase TusA family protein [Syntrophorhabdaceae bacterium]